MLIWFAPLCRWNWCWILLPIWFHYYMYRIYGIFLSIFPLSPSSPSVYIYLFISFFLLSFFLSLTTLSIYSLIFLCLTNQLTLAWIQNLVLNFHSWKQIMSQLEYKICSLVSRPFFSAPYLLFYSWSCEPCSGLSEVSWWFYSWFPLYQLVRTHWTVSCLY